jgi:hypothetical protein
MSVSHDVQCVCVWMSSVCVKSSNFLIPGNTQAMYAQRKAWLRGSVSSARDTNAKLSLEGRTHRLDFLVHHLIRIRDVMFIVTSPSVYHLLLSPLGLRLRASLLTQRDVSLFRCTVYVKRRCTVCAKINCLCVKMFSVCKKDVQCVCVSTVSA